MLYFLCSWQKLLWLSAVGNSVKVCVFFIWSMLQFTRISLLWLPWMTMALNWFNIHHTCLILLHQASIYCQNWKRQLLVPVFNQMMMSYMQWKIIWRVKKRPSSKVALRPFNIIGKSVETLRGIIVIQYVCQKSNIYRWGSQFFNQPSYNLKVGFMAYREK